MSVYRVVCGLWHASFQLLAWDLVFHHVHAGCLVLVLLQRTPVLLDPCGELQTQVLHDGAVAERQKCWDAICVSGAVVPDDVHLQMLPDSLRAS